MTNIPIARPPASLSREIVNAAGLMAYVAMIGSRIAPACGLAILLPLQWAVAWSDVLVAALIIGVLRWPPRVMLGLLTRSPIQITTTAFVAALVLSSALAGHFDWALAAKRAAVPLVLAAFVMVPDRRRLLFAVWLGVASTAFLFGVSLIVFRVTRPAFPRMVSFDGQLGPNQLAAMALLPLAICAAGLARSRGWWSWVVITVVATLLLYGVGASGSRAAIAAAAVTSVICTLLLMRPRVAVGIAVAASVAVLLIWNVHAHFLIPLRFEHAIQNTNGENNQSLTEWRQSVALFQAAPVAGVGVGNFRDASATGLAEPHNSYLQVLAEGGLLATVPAALLLVVVGRELWRNRWDAWVRACAAGLTGLAVYYGFHTYDRSLWLALAVTAALTITSQHQKERAI